MSNYFQNPDQQKEKPDVPDAQAETKWNQANISLENYQEFIKTKKPKFILTYLDLLYISNFKGGNASIHESENKANELLKEYSEVLVTIDKTFGNKTLSILSDNETEYLIELVNKFIGLTSNGNKSIYGFKASYASACLHAYFPGLIPILDRRIINSFLKRELSGQIPNAKAPEYMRDLIIQMKKEAQLTGKTLREIDKQYFSLKIYKPND